MSDDATATTSSDPASPERPGRPELLNAALWLAAGAAAAYVSYHLARVALDRFRCRDCDETKTADAIPLHAFTPAFGDATSCAACGRPVGDASHGRGTPRPAMRPPEPEPEPPATIARANGPAPVAAVSAVPWASQPETLARPHAPADEPEAEVAPELYVDGLSAADVLPGIAGGATTPGFARSFDEPGVGVQ